jgi:glycosyltransferase involved in cell wall biosynthesis
MRVIHATECAASGTLSVLLALTRQLSIAGAQQLIVYSERGETPRDLQSLFPAGVEFLKVPPASGTHLRFAMRFWSALSRALDDWRPDVLHLHSSKAGFIGRFVHAARHSPSRVFYSPHGLSFLDPDQPLRNFVFRSLETIAAWTGATAVACSRGEAELLAQVSSREVLLLENPVDERFFAVSRRPWRPRTVVTIGRLSRQKAPEKFAAVALATRSRAPEVRFVWIGDGHVNDKALLSAAGCEVTGWLSREEVAGLLALTDVYLQTSRWEGLPVSVMEALAAGVPCVVNDCVGNRDAVSHGVTGFVLDSEGAMAEHVLRLLDDASLRARMGASARSEAQRRFGSAAFATHVRHLYGAPEPQCPAVPAGETP